MPRPLRTLLVAALCLAGAPLAAQPGGAPQPQGAVPPVPAAQPASADPLRPGDVVRLRIWREPDLSGEFTVGPGGEVVLPKVGPLAVGGVSGDAARQRITGAYTAFLQHSSIEVVLLRRVQVTGAVRNPGLYNVDPTMTVSDALAMAGGATPQGDPKRVQLVRGGEKQSVRLTGSTPIAGSPVRSGDQLVVPERGWISRNTGIVAAAITGGVSLVIALLR